MVEIVEDMDDVVLVVRVVLLEIVQQHDLVQTLIEEVLVVLDDLDADHLAGMQIQALDRLRERRRAEILLHLIPCRNQRMQPDGEILVLLKAGTPPLMDDLQ